MIVVLDTNAALEIATGGLQARPFAVVLHQADQVIAPELLLLETGNALWKLHRFASLPVEDVDSILRDVVALIDEWAPIFNLYQSATSLAIRQGITVYDACYVDLALETGATLLTLDKKMAAAALELGIPLAYSP